jgi:hypothetical protein
MPFTKEHPMPGPGRPKGMVGVKTRVLNMLSDVIEEEGEDILHAALVKLYKRNPLEYINKYYTPFLPKEMKLDITGGMNVMHEVKQLDSIFAPNSQTEYIDATIVPALEAPNSDTRVSADMEIASKIQDDMLREAVRQIAVEQDLFDENAPSTGG